MYKPRGSWPSSSFENNRDEYQKFKILNPLVGFALTRVRKKAWVKYLRFTEDKYFADIATWEFALGKKEREGKSETESTAGSVGWLTRSTLTVFPRFQKKKNIYRFTNLCIAVRSWQKFWVERGPRDELKFHFSTAQTQVHLGHCALNEIFNRT